jgi:U4/U6.U5 tri-snRNP-associated protein 2
MHTGVGGTRKPNSSIIHSAFQGELYYDSQNPRQDENLELIKIFDHNSPYKTAVLPFIFLTLDLPMQPLFEAEESIVPQIPLSTLLGKYNGDTIYVKYAITIATRNS